MINRVACNQFCSVLTDPGLGSYAEMSAVSILALRHLHSGARSVLLVDRPTAAALEVRRHALLTLAGELLVVDTGTSDPMASSRMIKTTLRQRLAGDFLFVDADAIAVRSLTRGWPADVDLAAVRDLNRRRLDPDTRRHRRLDELSARFGWRFDDRRYLNSGVLWVRDTPGAHAFFAEWNRRWRLGAEQGVAFDQPAFNSYIAEGVARVGVLPDADNWMAWALPLFAGRARVFHFFASLNRGLPEPDTLLFRLVERYRETGRLEEAMLARAARENLPWLENVGARRLVSSGRYLDAVVAFIAKRLQRLASRGR